MSDDGPQSDILIISRGAGGVMMVVTGRGAGTIMAGVTELPSVDGRRCYARTDRRSVTVELETTRHGIAFPIDHDGALEAVSEWLVRP